MLKQGIRGGCGALISQVFKNKNYSNIPDFMAHPWGLLMDQMISHSPFHSLIVIKAKIQLTSGITFQLTYSSNSTHFEYSSVFKGNLK